MSRYLLAAKIAAVFTATTFLYVVVALHLFSNVVLRRHEPLSVHEAHDEFMFTVLWIGLGGSALMALFSVWVTRHLRRMSRSMDRIAEGDLDHRVQVRGRDEGAAIGRSFNAMADKVRTMVVGQRELMAGVSHELRSPLTRMKVSLSLLREKHGEGERIEALEQEVDALDELVGELLLASRIELQGAREREPFSLGDLCRAAWDRIATEADEKGMILQLAAGASELQVDVDRRLIERALGNLFENAVRYAESGPVEIEAAPVGDRVEVRITDHGPGVADAELARLFEPFFRVDPSRSRRTGAQGLGLMIVRRAVEAHGGTVAAARGTRAGLTVTLDLPAPQNRLR